MPSNATPLGQLGAGDMAKRGKHIDARQHGCLVGYSCRNDAGPAGDERQTQAAFVEAELATAIANRAAGQVRVGAVVAGENDERAVVDSELLEAVHQSTDLPVHFRHDRLQVFGNVRILLLLRFLVRNPRRMNIVEPEIDEARLVLVAAEEIERLVDEECVRSQRLNLSFGDQIQFVAVISGSGSGLS